MPKKVNLFHQYTFWGACWIVLYNSLQAQQMPKLDSIKYLLPDMTIQIEITEGINDMYNFKFERAESQFRWLLKHYPQHPLPYFLFGLSQWWKIMPNFDNTQYDEPLLKFIDKAIELAEKMFDKDKKNFEASFFLAISYGLKGQLYAYREQWTKATLAGKNAIKYMQYARPMTDLSPELLFGDGIYNYYSVWIPKEYPFLKPVMLFFEKGDKHLGLQQLEKASREAFYSRIEAQTNLMRIYLTEENQPQKALLIAENLHREFPNNPFFHRYYARVLYTLGIADLLEIECKEILAAIDSSKTGYEANSGRYASFFLAELYKNKYLDIPKAKFYYTKSVQFAEQLKNFKSGYYLYSLQALAKIAIQENQNEEAVFYFNKILEHADKDHATYQEAKKYKAQNKKEWKEIVKKSKEPEKQNETKQKKFWGLFE
ncbi:MAG: tol-pal system protein YbgF [Cytophagales bacterium]|nr:tol-pal system protein YbgF [Cytophagales bacterium]MDW8384840.1 tol-pal system protein YbgF [Flammeovirgaceae bacterium]